MLGLFISYVASVIIAVFPSVISVLVLVFKVGSRFLVGGVLSFFFFLGGRWSGVGSIMLRLVGFR